MAKPSYLQNIEKGKLLTGNNFPEFVNTWNYTIARVENLKGDRDSNPENGHITVDSTDPEHPVIRFVGKDAEDGGSEAGVKSIVGEYDSTAISGDVFAQGAEGSGIEVMTS